MFKWWSYQYLVIKSNICGHQDDDDANKREVSFSWQLNSPPFRVLRTVYLQ